MSYYCSTVLVVLKLLPGAMPSPILILTPKFMIDTFCQPTHSLITLNILVALFNIEYTSHIKHHRPINEFKNRSMKYIIFLVNTPPDES